MDKRIILRKLIRYVLIICQLIILFGCFEPGPIDTEKIQRENTKTSVNKSKYFQTRATKIIARWG